MRYKEMQYYRPRYSLVVDEDVKKPTNQPNKQAAQVEFHNIDNDKRRTVKNLKQTG